MSKEKLVADQWNWADKGILISAIVIFAGLFPTIEFSSFKVFIPLDSWLLILAGFSSLLYFVSIRVNQKEELRGNIIHNITPNYKSNLSKECFNVSIIIFVLFILRTGYLFLSEIP